MYILKKKYEKIFSFYNRGNKMEIEFVKGVGSGNDFVIIEKRYFSPELPVNILNRIYGVGGDGLIVYEGKKMWFYNPDGTNAKMCGNGVRVLFKYLYEKGILKEKDEIITESGSVKCSVSDEGVSTEFNFCKIENENPTVVRCGVPHLLIEKKDIDNINVKVEGYRMSNFLKERNNVDFFSLKGKDVFIRTYERGVEGETLSCGSGIASCAFYLNKKHNLNNFNFIARGGKFKVYIKDNNVIISGETMITMKGVYLWKNS
uniref:Diaminopimelate epimerase n=1 Tax=candidate division WOR-3 bacterium TaxID=2052148 RepID=A0A7C4Y5K2_UNCW3